MKTLVSICVAFLSMFIIGLSIPVVQETTDMGITSFLMSDGSKGVQFVSVNHERENSFIFDTTKWLPKKKKS